MNDQRPLVLDVDGTFLATDMLLETFWAGLGQNPWAVLKVLRFLGDRARLKAELAAIAEVRTDLFPVNPEVAMLAQAAQAEGREVILASASDASLVTRLAADYGMSPRFFASDGQVNLKSEAKARALVETFGERGFDYAGNSRADRAVWAHAYDAYVVGDEASARICEARGQPVARLASQARLAGLVKAFRPHQWVKNVLLFVPLLAGHVFAPMPWLLALLGLVAFSLAASSIYVVNDLLDLEADRLHVKKRFRPFAAGTTSLGAGMAAGGLAALIALGLAAGVGWGFFWIVVLYMTLSLSYSLRLKRLRWIDIATLAALYTIRVIAGALASGVGISGYLLVFIYPVFITLGAVKRITELTLATSDDRLPGRGYGKPDRGDLLNVSVIGMAGALLAFFAYSFTEQATTLYPTRWLLWLTLVPIAAWLYRMVRLGWLGQQDYDPMVFAMRDKRGIGILMIALALMFQAAGLWQHWFGI